MVDILSSSLWDQSAMKRGVIHSTAMGSGTNHAAPPAFKAPATAPEQLLVLLCIIYFCSVSPLNPSHQLAMLGRCSPHRRFAAPMPGIDTETSGSFIQRSLLLSEFRVVSLELIPSVKVLARASLLQVIALKFGFLQYVLGGVF